jgi:elongation factor G
MGNVVGDLNSKRAQIGQITDRSTAKVIEAKAPLAEMFGYATALRSMSQGRATFTMEFQNFAEVPKNVAEELIGDEKDKK